MSSERPRQIGQAKEFLDQVPLKRIILTLVAANIAIYYFVDHDFGAALVPITLGLAAGSLGLKYLGDKYIGK